MTITSQFPDMTSMSIFFDVFLFLLSSLVTGPNFMSISSLVLELWQFSFIRDWPEIRKSETPPSEFCPISGDWGKLWIPNLARMSLTECYWLLQNSRVTAFTVFELFRGNQLGGKITPLQIRVKMLNHVTTSQLTTSNQKRYCFFSFFKYLSIKPIWSINSFYTAGLSIYPLKKWENLWFSDVFRGYKKSPVA